jgi:hypothetical protein
MLMATYPIHTVPEVRSERIVVLMTPREKRDLSARAREAGVSVGEYMRLAAEFETLSRDEKAQLETLVSDLRAATERTQATLDRLEATAARVIDEDALRARSRAELEAMDIDWASLGNRLGLRP